MKPHNASDLLELQYVFGQRGLLTPDEFIKAAEKRGVRLTIGHLEALHRSGDLRPLFRMDLSEEEIVKAWEPDGYMIPSPDLGLHSLRQLAAKGKLVSLGDDFRTWSRYTTTRDTHLLWVSTMLYSPWQLLGLIEAQALLPSMRRIKAGSFGQRYSTSRPVLMSTHMTTSIAIVLSALEPLYWPDTVQTVRFAGPSLRDRDEWFNAYLQWMRNKKAADLSTWLDMSHEEIVSLADGLALRVKNSDPIDGWAGLTRMMSPDRWKELKGDARIAIEHRIAAEMLLRLRDDLNDEGAAPPLPELPAMAWTPQHDRLNRSKGDLDQVLTSYGLSPHPSLVMPLEGATEMILVGRAMKHLHIPKQRNYIELFDIGGNTNDYGLLARYVAVPELGKPIREGMVLLNRPITRIFVVTDPENLLRTEEDRDKKRAAILQSIIESLPPEFRTSKARQQFESLVTFDTWTNNESFEFAHFSDDEIVQAIEKVYSEADLSEPSVSVDQIRGIRERRGNLKSLLRKFPGLSGQKARLAEALWPTLRDRIDEHLRDGTLDSIPLGRILRRATELATMSVRRNIGLEH